MTELSQRLREQSERRSLSAATRDLLREAADYVERVNRLAAIPPARAQEAKELLTAKDEGRLLLLPCKIGERVYVVSECEEMDGSMCRAIEETNLAGYINEDGRGFYLCYDPEYGSMDVETKNLFVTWEKAEAAKEEA